MLHITNGQNGETNDRKETKTKTFILFYQVGFWYSIRFIQQLFFRKVLKAAKFENRVPFFNALSQ